MTRAALIEQVYAKQSFLCIGLDPDLQKIPSFLLKEKDPIFEFNRRVIDATHDLCVAYKLNTAFYECQGAKGWETLKKTVDYIPSPLFTIADAKRGDIGHTAQYYARAFFEEMDVDAVTVTPYMGMDSITPFLEFDGKWVIVLALTSNKGALDFQLLSDRDGECVFEKVIRAANQWGSPSQIMYVVGATRSDAMQTVRKHAPNHFLLVPGIGAQGGVLEDVVKWGGNQDGGLLVNASRGVIYAGKGADFATSARRAALHLQTQMKQAFPFSKQPNTTIRQ